jgi:hypothetical protein
VSAIHDRIARAHQLLLGAAGLLQENLDEVSADDIEAALQDMDTASDELNKALAACEDEKMLHRGEP